VALLTALRGRAAFLYLVGDVFDFWFEYRRATTIQSPSVLGALSKLSSAGTVIRFLGGNHDYWAGGTFESLTGAAVFRDPLIETHHGLRLFTAHGDGLPSGDLGYRVLRAIIRSRPAIAAFRIVPPGIGAAVGRWASGLSEITDERIRNAIPAMRAFLLGKLEDGFDAAIVGHVHRQLIWRTDRGTAVIVGDWMRSRSVVRLAADGFTTLRWSNGALEETSPEVPKEEPVAAD